MAMTINTNIQSLNAQRNLGTSQSSLSTSMQRLSSGLRINSAKDDAAGLAIAERMSAQITGLNQAQRNANDGVSLAQTAEGALSTIGGNLQRIRELAVQSRNATNSADDRQALNAEVQQLKQEIQRVAENTSFNGTKLLDGSFLQQSFQVGANQSQTINISQIANANVSELGSWNSAVTNASVTGAVPDGGAVKAVANVGSTSGAFTTSAASSATTQEFSLTVDGVEVIKRAGTAGGTGTGAAVTATDVQGALDSQAVQDALKAKGITVSGTVAGNNLAFSRADGKAFDVAVVNTFGATPAGGFATAAFNGTQDNGTEGVDASFSAITAGQLTLKGVTADGKPGAAVDIVVGKSDSASDRTTALVNAVNAKTHETGVTASVVNGKLSLESKFGDFTIGSSLAADKLEDATGLKAGVSGAVAGGTAYAKGTAQTGFADLDISSTGGADNAILAMDAALKAVNSARADLGAIQNRFESVVSNLSVNSENMSASKSRIMDADFASETANLSRSQILQQAGTAMVAQANQLPQGVLSLLR
ncbi:flagellin [Comamonas thiooxydans]|uniref:flagellin N-terminal helical domain-containing protein n=1 Tax=Comamonas thiooxydans TaxID=363952 RepID=UPI00311FCD35